jgi:hypothetical protein
MSPDQARSDTAPRRHARPTSELASLCTHQAFHTSNRIVRGAGLRMARTRRSQAGTTSRRSNHALAPQLVASAKLLGSQQTFTDRAGESTRCEGVTDRYAPTGHPAHAVPLSKLLHDASGVRIGERCRRKAGFAHLTREDLSCLGRAPSGALPTRRQVLRARGPTGLGLV